MINIKADNHRIMSKEDHPLRLELAATILVCTAYIVFFLSLPLFPTQDGPMHLYNVHVMGKLLAHSSAAYDNFYKIKHLLPPYSLYYYALLTLGRVFPLLLADRLILCFYVLLFVFGFRYLARAIGQSADLMTLLVSTLLLCWPLGMGFVNFCLSLSIAFWTLGLWTRCFASSDLRRKAAVVGLAAIMMLVHPVPLILALVLMSLQFVVFLFRDRKRAPDVPVAVLLQDIVTLALVASTGFYIRLFTTNEILKQDTPAPIRKVIRDRFYSLYHQGTLSVFSDVHRPLYIFRLGLGLIPVFCFSFALIQARRRRIAVAELQWLAYAILAWIIFPFLPDELNGSFYFADRLTILLWITPLLAASAFAIPRSTLRYAIVGWALALNAANLVLAQKYIRPVAEDLARIERLQPQWNGKVGLLLESGRGQPEGLSYRPYYHSAAHFFRENDAILDDTPWLDLAIIPLGYRPSAINLALNAAQLESAATVTQAITASSERRAAVLSNVDFILIPHVPSNSLPDPYEVMRLDAQSVWNCTSVENAEFQLCIPHSRSAASPTR